MQNAVALHDLRRLQHAWIAVTTVSIVAGFYLLSFVSQRASGTLVVALLLTVLLSFVGAAQVAAVMWWERSLGREIWSSLMAASWVASWAGAGLLMLALAPLIDPTLGLGVAFVLLIIVQAVLLRAFSWLLASVVGAVLGYSFFFILILRSLGFDEPTLWTSLYNMFTVAVGIGVYGLFTAIALARITRLRSAA